MEPGVAIEMLRLTRKLGASQNTIEQLSGEILDQCEGTTAGDEAQAKEAFLDHLVASESYLVNAQ